MTSRMAEAATPGRRPARRRRGPPRRAAPSRSEPGSLTRADLLQLGAELGEDLAGVDALGRGLLDPVLDEGRGALLDLGHEGGIGVDDLHARLLERAEALRVGGGS